MSSISFLILLITVLPIFSLAAWVWLMVVYADDDLLSYSSIPSFNNEQGFS